MSKSIILLTMILSCFILEANEWTHSSGSYKAHRYYNGNQINLSNIDDLERAWKFSSRKSDEIMTVQASPIYSGTQIISTSFGGFLKSNTRSVVMTFPFFNPKDTVLFPSNGLSSPKLAIIFLRQLEKFFLN